MRIDLEYLLIRHLIQNTPVSQLSHVLNPIGYLYSESKLEHTFWVDPYGRL